MSPKKWRRQPNLTIQRFISLCTLKILDGREVRFFEEQAAVSVDLELVWF